MSSKTVATALFNNKKYYVMFTQKRKCKTLLIDLATQILLFNRIVLFVTLLQYIQSFSANIFT